MAKHQGKQPVSAFDLFGKSYEAVMRNIKTFAILMALPAIAAIASTIRYNVDDKANRYSHINFFSGTEPAYAIIGIASLSFIFLVLLAIAALLLQAMLTGLETEAAKNKTPSLSHLWALGKKYWLRLFGLTLVIGLYILGASLIGGLVLLVLRSSFIGWAIGIGLILAAILFVLTHYYLAPFAMVDEDLSIFDALDRSANLSRQYVWSVLSVIGVSILLAFTGIIPILGPIISFVLAALYSVAPPLRYLELKKLSK